MSLMASHPAMAAPMQAMNEISLGVHRRGGGEFYDGFRHSGPCRTYLLSRACGLGVDCG